MRISSSTEKLLKTFQYLNMTAGSGIALALSDDNR